MLAGRVSLLVDGEGRDPLAGAGGVDGRPGRLHPDRPARWRTTPGRPSWRRRSPRAWRRGPPVTTRPPPPASAGQPSSRPSPATTARCACSPASSTSSRRVRARCGCAPRRGRRRDGSRHPLDADGAHQAGAMTTDSPVTARRVGSLGPRDRYCERCGHDEQSPGSLDWVIEVAADHEQFVRVGPSDLTWPEARTPVVLALDGDEVRVGRDRAGGMAVNLDGSIADPGSPATTARSSARRTAVSASATLVRRTARPSTTTTRRSRRSPSCGWSTATGSTSAHGPRCTTTGPVRREPSNGRATCRHADDDHHA